MLPTDIFWSYKDFVSKSFDFLNNHAETRKQTQQAEFDPCMVGAGQATASQGQSNNIYTI